MSKNITIVLMLIIICIYKVSLAATYSSSWIYDPNTGFYGWHDQTASEYQATFDEMAQQGYRLISIDTHVLNGVPYYASAWIYDPNTGFYGWHDQTASEYQATFDEMAQQGYRLISIDTHVLNGVPYYASAWIYDPNTGFYGWHGQTASEYQAIFDEMAQQGYRLISIDTHVLNGVPYYASAWIYDPNTGFYGWHDQTASEYQATFDEMAQQGYRLISIDTHVLNGVPYYASAWIYDPNTGFYGWHGQTASEYQATFDEMAQQGYRLVDINTYAEDEDAEHLYWQISGETVSDLEIFDQTMKSFMGNRNISQGALAVTYNGRLIFARGYSLGGDTKQTNPLTLFRIASLSKPITATAVMKLVQQEQLNLDDTLLDILNIDETVDPRISQIKIRQLLQHIAGWDSNITFDPMFYDIAIATELDVVLPVTKSQIIEYMNIQNLQHAPGETYAYSNYGYMLLGMIVEKVSNQSYEEYVKNNIFQPLGIENMQLGYSLEENQLPNEVSYQSQYMGTTVMDSSGTSIPLPYGGFNIENMDSHGGWVGSVVEMARFATLFDFPGNNPVLCPDSIDKMFALPENMNAENYNWGEFYYGLGWAVKDFGGGNRNVWHEGSLPGTHTLMVRRKDGLSWIAFFNQRDDSSGLDYSEIDTMLHDAADSILVFPEHDFFENYLSDMDEAPDTMCDKNIECLVLTNTSPVDISTGLIVKVYGSSDINIINVFSGAEVECINFSGSNVINIVEDLASDFTVCRSGSMTYFESTVKGTIVKIPATMTSQTIKFSDDSSYNLVISNNKVMIGDKEITLIKTQL